MGGQIGGRATDVRIEKVVTSGTFSLDGGTWAVTHQSSWRLHEGREASELHSLKSLI